MHAHNQALFDMIRRYHLPTHQYAIIGSGALGIRNLRKINDVDLIITEELWEKLATTYPLVDDGKTIKLEILPEVIDAFHEGSFYFYTFDTAIPSIETRIQEAEIIDGLPFEKVEHVLFFKQKMAREKDLKDVELLTQWQKSHQANI